MALNIQSSDTPAVYHRCAPGAFRQTGVLFGSHAREAATVDSDVDVAVAFDEELSPAERLEQRIKLTTDLIEVLRTDDVDVADLDAIRPEVGAAALRTGTPLLGDREILETYLTRFDEEISHDSHEERMRRFDALLERLEAQV